MVRKYQLQFSSNGGGSTDDNDEIILDEAIDYVKSMLKASVDAGGEMEKLDEANDVKVTLFLPGTPC
jgi:precorrin-6x reductase